MPREYDGTDAKPNLCGATRPVCANRADPTANLGLALDSQTTNAASGFSEASANDRDVVFLVDVSDTVTRDAFDEKLTELLLTLFCASHEGTESQAGVVLYPAPKSGDVRRLPSRHPARAVHHARVVRRRRGSAFGHERVLRLRHELRY